MIIKRGRWRWTCQAGCKNTHCHYDPVTSTLCFHLFPSLSLSLSLFGCISDCIADSTPGSLSNSTGLVHQNRSPAVIAAFLPVTTARGVERFLSDTAGTPRKQEVGAKTACSNPLAEPVRKQCRRQTTYENIKCCYSTKLIMVQVIRTNMENKLF